jgi:nitrogen fixation protein FixH
MIAAPTPAGFVVRGWHVLAAVTAFFAIVIGFDVAFAVMAYRSAPGESAANPYEAGLAYEKILDERAREARLGWRATLAREGDAVVIDVVDSAGAPLSGLTVEGFLSRPATEKGRQAVSLAETAPGVYRLAPRRRSGAWDLAVTARDRGEGRLEIARRLLW